MQKVVRIRARSQKRDKINSLVNTIVKSRQLDEDHVYLHELDAAREEALGE